MYIGVWPEYHFAKLVAESEKLAASDAGTPTSASHTPVLLPPCHRVDISRHSTEVAPSAARWSIGPEQLPASRRCESENRRQTPQAQAGRLPPLPRASSSGPQRHGRASERSHSRPRLFAPQLPQSSSSSSTPRAPVRSPPSAATTQSCSSAASSGPSTCAASPPRLACTPPWQARLPPRPPQALPAGVPGWIASMREDIEKTRTLFTEGPVFAGGNESQPLRRVGSLEKLVPLAPRWQSSMHAEEAWGPPGCTSMNVTPETGATDRAQGIAPAPEAVPVERMTQEIVKVGREFESGRAPRTAWLDGSRSGSALVLQPDKDVSPSHIQSDDEAEDEDLIAWSQGLCLEDFDDPEDGVLQALAEIL
eukprot:TRINITY_DN31488_c0_g1_i2.p1 TRINITY_DN31488_c0_g1~~TRINITY_DN31488_c0_g1_i2.p1  ORF type:complete len:365 (-),score=62.89 TRINITY_DN31488_c0_g1_i2:26-1120(-)